MFTQLLAIVRNTFVESIRQPIMVVLIIAANTLIILSVAGAANTLDDDNLMFIQIALSTLLVAGLLMAGFTATGVLTLEIENKTALTVVSKPVTRPVFIIGKYLGVAGALTVAMWPLFMTTLLFVRHGVMQTASHHYDGPVIVFSGVAYTVSIVGSLLVNYLYRRPFVSTFVWSLAILKTLALLLVLVVGKEWTLQAINTEFVAQDGRFPQVLMGALLLYQALLIYCAVAIVASTRLGQVPTIVITVVYGYLMSMVGSIKSAYASTERAGGVVEGAVRFLANLLYHVTPDLNFLWVADDLSTGLSVSTPYVVTVTLYSVLFILALLGLAIALFQTREVG
jgi:ABC-type transport system involved in multi-copper enzyme maturation permease subunit